MPAREGDLQAVIESFRNAVFDRLADNAEFHDVLNEGKALEFEGLDQFATSYRIQCHEALIWTAPDAYLAEHQRWQEATDYETNRSTIDYLKNSGQLSVFRDLVEVIRRKRVAPFVGAGSSACLAFPLWKQGLEDLTAKLDTGDPSTKARCQIARNAINIGDYIEAGAILYDIDKTQVDNFVRTTYSVPPSLDQVKVSGPVLLLPELTDGCIITTNFDNLIEEVFKAKGKPIEGYMHGSQKHHKFAVNLILGDRCILKLHGDADDPDTYIFSKPQYDRAYGSNLNFAKPLAKSLRQVYVSHSMLFIGCSLNADRTMEVFEAVKKGKQFDLPDHYAILNAPETKAERNAKDNRLLKLNIRAIWHENKAYDMVEKILQLAIDCARGRVSV